MRMRISVYLDGLENVVGRASLSHQWDSELTGIMRLSLSFSPPLSLFLSDLPWLWTSPSISEGFSWISQHWWTPLLNGSVCLPGWTCACVCHWSAGEYLKTDSSEWAWNTSRSTALTLSLSVSPLCLSVGGSSPRRPALHLASTRLTEDNTFLPGR